MDLQLVMRTVTEKLDSIENRANGLVSSIPELAVIRDFRLRGFHPKLWNRIVPNLFASVIGVPHLCGRFAIAPTPSERQGNRLPAIFVDYLCRVRVRCVSLLPRTHP
jgi:hypothetical protein